MNKHHFVAHSFSRSFPMAEVAKIFSAQPTQINPKSAAKVLAPDGRSGVFIFDFGALTFWNCNQEFIQAHIARVERHDEEDTNKGFTSDDYYVEETPEAKPSVQFNALVIDRLTTARAEVVAQTLAQSAAMEVKEAQVESIRGAVSGLIEDLRRRGRVSPSTRRFQRLIADVVSARNNIIGVLHLLDRPDIIWEDQTMDAHYEALRTSFDLDERFQALQYKLESIQDSLEIIIDIARDHRLFLVEVAIVVLILVEIVLTLIKY